MYEQLLFNTIVSASLLAVIAIGFNLIFYTTKVFHLAHGAIYIVGPYALLQFLSLNTDPSLLYWMFAIMLSLLIVCGIAYLIERLVYYPMFEKKAGQSITLISSVGVYLFLLNFIAMCYGNEAQFINPKYTDTIVLGTMHIAPIQLIQLLVCVCLLFAVHIASTTNWFLKVRAMVSNDIVASVMGVNTKRVRLSVIFIGSLLAAIAAILKLYDTGINPYSGMQVTLTAAAAVIIGGAHSLRGTLIAAFLIVSFQTLTEWFFSSQWRDGLTFLLLIIVILWRTEGITSFKMRVEEA